MLNQLLQSELKRKIYEAMDSFLVEAKDQFGNDRNLERLNKDRHLFVKKMMDILSESNLRVAQAARKEVLEEVVERIERMKKKYPPNLKEEIWSGEGGLPNTKIESPDVFGIKFVDGYNEALFEVIERLTKEVNRKFKSSPKELESEGKR